ncbi:hypothetical protein FO519_006756 [Halicephalobus sp. NKZ332]|nr:hypothetical protein FO519_006756 [Halicephalobus sp. NKZ332]
MESKPGIFGVMGGETETPSTSKLTLPVLAKKVKKLASKQFLSLKMLLNGRGFSKFKKYYKLKGEIGQGGFGIVYSAVRMSDGMPVAVKFIERKHIRDWGKLDDERVPMEICMLARCSRIDGVIKLLDWYSMPEGYLIVMERPSPCIDLFDFIRRQKRLNEDDENVVIDLITGETRLIDFGAATLLKKTRYHDFQGTRLYCPPEWFLHALYLGKEAAVWSLGILLYNMLNGKLPFQNEKHICTSHLLGPLPFCAEVSDEARDLVCKCLTFDPFSRLPLEKVLNHPWFNAKETDWYNIAVDISLAYPIKNMSVDEEQPDEDSDAIVDCEADIRVAENCRKESGVASGSNSFEKQEQSNNNDSPHEKPETTIAKGTDALHVRRNAKTSVLHPKGCMDYNTLASQSRKKNPSVYNKSKSGSMRPTLQSRATNIVASVDSGTSSFAFNCSRDSLQSPLGSPLIQTNDCCQFPDVAPPGDRV